MQMTFELAVRGKGLASGLCVLCAEAWVRPWWQTLLQRMPFSYVALGP